MAVPDCLLPFHPSLSSQLLMESVLLRSPSVTNLLLHLSREGDVRIYSARELEELLSAAFHGAECRRAGPTALVAWGVK